jgi:hypothetical protein
MDFRYRKALPREFFSCAAPRFEDAYVVMRPDALQLSKESGGTAWRGRVTNRRFAGGVVVYRVKLADDVTVDVESTSGETREDETVGVTPLSGPFPIVPG